MYTMYELCVYHYFLFFRRFIIPIAVKQSQIVYQDFSKLTYTEYIPTAVQHYLCSVKPQ